MGLYPDAVNKLLPENEVQPSIVPTQVILHSAVDAPGPSTLFPYFARLDVNLESHFFIRLDGRVEQYMNTTVRADANYHANLRPDGTGAISVETEDEGNPDERPWTSAQVGAIKSLLEWIWEVHPTVKRQVCGSEVDPGVGFHTMWGAPSEWTPVPGKTCPGGIRKAQFWTTFAPWIESPATSAGECEDDMFTFGYTKKPVFFVAGGVKNGMHSSAELAAVRRAYKAEHGRDLMHITCATEVEFNTFYNNYPGK